VNGRAMYAFQGKKNKDKPKEVTQSTEPEPNKNAIGSHPQGVQSKSHERTFLSR
jgi:hypothetical protein